MLRHALIILSLCFAIAASAQSPEFHQISDQDNLPCNEIYQIYFDKEGYMWLGTEIGAFRYDGQHFESYSPDIGSGQALTGYTEIGEKLYLFNFLGNILYLEGDSLKHINVPKSVMDRNYAILMKGYDEKLWIYGNKGIFNYEDTIGSWKNRTPEGFNEIDFSFAKSGAKRNDSLWFITAKSIISLSSQGNKEYPVRFGKGQDPSLPRHLLHAGKSGVWLCHITSGAVFHLQDSVFVPFHQPQLDELLKHKKFTNLQEVNGILYFMAYDGLVSYNPATQEAEWLFKDLPITDLEVDPEGNYWVSTLGYGLLYCSNFEIRSFPDNRKGGSSYKFTNLVPDGNGGIYYSRLSGGIGHVTEGKNLLEIKGPIQADISCLSYTEGKEVFVAFNNVVYQVVNDKLVTVNAEFPAIKDLLKSGDKYYVASSTGLFYRPSLRHDKNVERLLESWCRKVIQGDGKDVWVGASDGLYLVNENSIVKTYLEGEGIEDVLWVPELKTLFFSSMSGQIYELKDGKMRLYRKAAVSGTQVYRMRWKKGHLWLATSKGLGRIHRKSKSETWFDIQDGLSSNIIYDLIFQDNVLWIATGNGLQKLPADLVKNNAEPKLYLKHALVNGHFVDPYQIQSLTSTDELELDFHLISFYSQGNYTLAYSWDNKKWTRLQAGQSSFLISNLPSDAKQIYVRGIDSKGKSSAPIILNLDIHPPFYQSTAFFVLAILLTISAVTVLFLIYLRQVRRKQENALERAKLKTNLIESQLTALKAQMNPHFIFNSLNSIYELIIFSETKEAATYLNKFATLLRKVLENSEKEGIPLNEECEWLSLYLELEKLRFGSDFSYQISMEKLNDPFTIMVPTMLLQPFVENAVKHGLLHKSGIKRLEIEFTEESGILECVIRDNGVGREKAEKYRKSKIVRHKSFATGAINRRISILNDSGKYYIELKIEDLEFPNGEPAGTEVKLSIRGW